MRLGLFLQRKKKQNTFRLLTLSTALQRSYYNKSIFLNRKKNLYQDLDTSVTDQQAIRPGISKGTFQKILVEKSVLPQIPMTLAMPL